MSLSIAMVCPYCLDEPGGVGTHVLGLARWLRRQGHRPTVIAPGTRPVSGVEARLLGPCLAVPFNGSTARLAVQPTQIRAVRRLIAGADIVHVHEPLTPGIAYAAARASQRLVVTHHAAYHPGLLAPLLRARAAWLPQRRVSIAVSASAAETARQVTGVEPWIVPNGIDLPTSSAQPRDAVVFLGRLDDPRKGYDMYLRLADLFAEVDFLAIGPGGRGAGRVHELGQLPRRHVSRCLERARILVAPNRFGESFGLILVEALAHGASVVASDLPAFRAVIGDTHVASFFPPDDTRAAAQALQTRLARPDAPHAARAAAQRFSWGRVGPRILDAYAWRTKPLEPLP